MRAFLDETPKIDYIDIVLDEEEMDMLPRRAIIKEYFSIFEGKRSSKILNIMVRPKKISEEALDAIKERLELSDYL